MVVPLGGLIMSITGDAGYVVDDGLVVVDEFVEYGGFSYVGFSYDGDDV